MTNHSFSDTIIKWQKNHGRRHLPWQLKKTPYRVWVSEIMLQQTQVQTVIPYYDRFMQRFPDIQSLAAADINEVMHLWSGLGYYARGKNLHRAACQICAQHGGVFPKDYDSIIQLSGIGPSTAGAILSLSMGQSAVVLDGNVKRVIARHQGLFDDFSQTKPHKQLWQLAEQLLPQKSCDRYNQGLMDIGATCCTQAQPNCRQCPLAKSCYANLNHCQKDIPVKKARTPKPTKSEAFLLIVNEQHVLLKKRPSTGIWSNLWCLPSRSEAEKLSTDWQEHLPVLQDRTTFTHYHLDYTVTPCTNSDFTLTSKEWLWYNQENPPAIGLPAPITQVINQYFNQSHAF